MNGARSVKCVVRGIENGELRIENGELRIMNGARSVKCVVSGN